LQTGPENALTMVTAHGANWDAAGRRRVQLAAPITMKREYAQVPVRTANLLTGNMPDG
jgi:hypothetical protein